MLRESFGRLYFQGQTFGDLQQKQEAGASPTLIINGTVMDTGSKFLFTTLQSTESARNMP